MQLVSTIYLAIMIVGAQLTAKVTAVREHGTNENVSPNTKHKINREG